MSGLHMLGRDRLQDAVKAGGIDVPPEWHDEIGSTNTRAVSLAEEGAPAWTLVAAGHQTAGRGRRGRSWIDRPGGALMFSIILRPGVPPSEAPIIALLAAAEMIDATGFEELRTKWPNDLVVDERKLGGILAEARVHDDRLTHVILGVGVNVDIPRAEFPEDLRDRATSLAAEGFVADPAGILGRFLRSFRGSLDGPWLPEGVIERYVRVCSTLGRAVRATTMSGTVVEGTAVGLDRHGALEVDSSGRREAVAFGEIAHLR